MTKKKLAKRELNAPKEVIDPKNFKYYKLTT